MSERATERDGEHVTAIKSDETGRWVRIPDGVDGVRAYQLLRAASTDAPSEELDLPALTYAASQALDDGDDDIAEALIRIRDRLAAPSEERTCPKCGDTGVGAHTCRAPTDEAPERERDNPPWEPTPENVERWAEARRRNGDTEAVVRLTVIARRLRQPEPAREGERLMWLVGDGQLFYYDDEDHARDYAENDPHADGEPQLVAVRNARRSHQEGRGG